MQRYALNSSPSYRCDLVWRAASALFCSQSVRARAQGDPVLTIGTSMLVGKVVKLPRPLVVVSSDGGDGDGDDDNVGGGNDDSDNAKSVKRARLANDRDNDNDSGEPWSVVGVVRKKLLFKTRPQPIVSK